MYTTKNFFPESGQSLWNIKNPDYTVHINWSKKPFEDYKKLSLEYAQCAYLIFQEVINNGTNHIKTDMWFLPGIFFMRHSIELGLKSLICRIYKKKSDAQTIFVNCCHDLSKLFSKYLESSENYLLHNEIQWLNIYLDSLESIDRNSDLFRFPFKDNTTTLSKYKNEFIDVISTSNNLIQAFSIVKKCINCGVYDSNFSFHPELKPQFLPLANSGMHNCDIWEQFSDDGFHKKINGYIEVASFIFYNCNALSVEDKFFSLCFLLRNTIELCLKRLIYNGIGDIGHEKYSHLLKNDLWKNVKPLINPYSSESDKISLNIVESIIFELNQLDKNGDHFRYPSSYSFEYKLNNIDLDLKNIFECMLGSINFLDSCDMMLYCMINS